MSAPVRLDSLPPAGRAIVLALIEARAAAKKMAAPANVAPEAATEARRARDERPTAA